MKQYKTYKDSGVEWLGGIPEHWSLKKTVYEFKAEKGRNAALLTKEYCSTIKGEYSVYSGQTENDGIMSRINSFEFDSIDRGCILSTTVGANAMSTKLLKEKFSLSQNCMIISLRTEGMEIDYFYYYFKVLFSFLRSQIPTHMQPSFRIEDFYASKTLFPSIKEQTQIADYLNHKTVQLDTLIAKKEQLINLLQEERTAMINQAVTKGLDSNIPMKDSGIEWLGEIPAHWGLKKLRYLGNNQNGISEGADFFGKGFPFVSYSDVFKNRVLPIKASGLANSNEKHWSNYSVEEGDVFFTRTSETIEDIGMSSVCKKTIDKATFAGFLIRFRPDKGKLDIDFSKYYFSCFIPRVFFVKEMNLVTRASLSQELLKRLPVLVPSIEEQFKIAQYLNIKTEKIDITLNNISKQIIQLKEYKTALISEVVTGKVDVREEVLN